MLVLFVCAGTPTSQWLLEVKILTLQNPNPNGGGGVSLSFCILVLFGLALLNVCGPRTMCGMSPFVYYSAAACYFEQVS